MSQEQVPDDVDWVSSQANCSADLVFERLRAGVREDIRRRNGLRGRQDGWKFEFHEDGDDFEALRVVAAGFTGASASAVVRFERAGRRILVQGEDVDVDFTAVATLDAAGLCRLVVGEAMYAEWEIRRMALELLFFEDTDESG